MRYIVEEPLCQFQFWSGAKHLADLLTDSELFEIEYWLDDSETPLTECQINDFFWFDDETIATILGYEDADTLWNELLKRERERMN